MATTGTVKWFDAERGYGFIAQDGDGPDLFVHITAIQRAGLDTLREGQRLEFLVERDNRTRKLRAVELVDPLRRRPA
jgi:cold shock protein